MSPRRRFAPPGVSMTDMGTVSSFQSMAWCSKNTESAAIERQFGDRDHVAVDLHRARPEVDFGQIPQAGGLAPPGIAHPVTLIERRAAAVTTPSLGEVVGVAPLALDPLSDVSHVSTPKAFCAIARRGLRPPQWSGPSVPQFGAEPPGRLPHAGAPAPITGHPRAMSAGLHVASSLVTLTLPRMSSIEISSRGRLAVAGGP